MAIRSLYFHVLVWFVRNLNRIPEIQEDFSVVLVINFSILVGKGEIGFVIGE